MKRLFLLVFVTLTMGSLAEVAAQPRSIGGRLGYGIGASYQHSFGQRNMLQADLEFPGFAMGVQATATYNWLFPIKGWPEAGSWNWYAGVGASLGLGFGPYAWIGVAGMIGAEYNFEFPLTLSFDFRPVIGPSFGYHGGSGFNTGGFYAGAFAIGAKYRF